tara:strand:+ start:2116 stop:2874 length:759 start_codon:yes stop_codon:yes gene_type:complete
MTNKKLEIFNDLLCSCWIVDNDATLDKPAELVLEHHESTKIVSFLNFHAINISIENSVFYNALKESDFLYRDGVGIEVALKSIGHSSGKNMNGTDFIPNVIHTGIKRKLPFVLWGTEDIYLMKVKEVIENASGVVANTLDGFQEFECYLEKLKELELKNVIVILGMGMPKQEVLAIQIKQEFPTGFTIINGGAIIDFIAGKQPRAPLYMRKLKLEFLYRLMLEPKRLFKRTIVGGFSFVFLIANNYLKKLIS